MKFMPRRQGIYLALCFWWIMVYMVAELYRYGTSSFLSMYLIFILLAVPWISFRLIVGPLVFADEKVYISKTDSVSLIKLYIDYFLITYLSGELTTSHWAHYPPGFTQSRMEAAWPVMGAFTIILYFPIFILGVLQVIIRVLVKQEIPRNNTNRMGSDKERVE
jgi:hypothetical protein